ncbi:MAG: hypothetical protein EOO12_05900 [Chitinophagaceae bacterium]|nr:MAG: hypothetical protein EOO12_05900 [Chitinophagaceae bacterium]
MNIVSKIWRRAARLPFAQEYLCVDAETFADTLFVYDLRDGRVHADVTKRHSLVGYSPLLLAFPPETDAPPQRTLLFCSRPCVPGQQPPGDAVLASLELRLFPQSSDAYVLYEGIFVRHRLLPFWKRCSLDAYNNRRHGEAGNVHLPGNRYQQVQVAYALPRSVCLISVCSDGGCNLFPTDLHGPVGNDRYLISLRIGGKACAQVEEAGELLLAQMAPAQAGLVYSLGRNHMRPLRPAGELPFSGTFCGLPVPEGAARLRHLRLRGAQDAGIHRLLLFDVAAERAGHQQGHLAHVHAAYATWRLRHGHAGNYLTR